MEGVSPVATPRLRRLSETLFSRLIFGLLGAGFATMLLIVGTTLWLAGRSQQFSALVNHTYQVETQVADLRVLFERTEAGRRGYLISGESFYRDVFDQTWRQIPPAIDELARLTLDNDAQRDRITSLRPQMQILMQQMSLSVERARTGDLEGGRKLFLEEANGPQITGIRQLLSEMQNEENRLLALRNERQVSNARLLMGVVTGAGALLAVLALSSLLIMRRYARDLQHSQAELQVLNRGLEEAVRERTADLTRANEEIQRFAYIVTHDLRAPLVNIMGFTSELEGSLGSIQTYVRQSDETSEDATAKEARTASLEDLPEAIGFIRSSTKKMDGLINAILKLSREGRRVLRPENIELDTLLKTAAANVQHQVTEAGGEVSIEGYVPPVVSDRLALEQIFGNLFDNAVKYRARSRPLQIKVRTREELGQRIVVEVEDNGRGISKQDHERVFDLFRRSGSQDQPGEGIGLAHVRTMIRNLGGDISLKSDIEQGTTMKLSLPRDLRKFIEITKHRSGVA